MMQFSNFESFLAMGGYGFYVWLAFGVSLVAMLMILVHSVYSRHQLRRQVIREKARKARIKAVHARKHQQQRLKNAPDSAVNEVSPEC